MQACEDAISLHIYSYSVVLDTIILLSISYHVIHLLIFGLANLLVKKSTKLLIN